MHLFRFTAALLAFFQGGLEILRKKEKDMRKRQMLLDGMNRRYDSDRALWAYVRSRLEVSVRVSGECTRRDSREYFTATPGLASSEGF